MKIHQTGTGEIIAISDTELIGSTYEDERACIIVTADFFGTGPVSESEIEKALKEGTNIIMIGTQTVALAVQMGVLCEDDILLIQGVPYATVLRF